MLTQTHFQDPSPREAALVPDRGRSLSRVLMEAGTVSAADMLEAMGQATATGAPLRRILLAAEKLEPDALTGALARRYGALHLSRARHPPDPSLAALLPPETCLAEGVLPWMRIGGTLILAAGTEAGFTRVAARLRAEGMAVAMAIAPEAEIEAEIAERHGRTLVARAETQIPAAQSCREMAAGPGLRLGALALAGAALGALAFAPLALFALLLAMALGSLVVMQGLKLAALLASRVPQTAPPSACLTALPSPLPHVTLLVPLFREAEITQHLTARIERLTYPKSCLTVFLVLEDLDTETAARLRREKLPPWIRTIVVPGGTIRTKPRALNYALRFARGEVIGILDAEDAPAPDQVERIVATFAAAPPEVACLQGILDFYNPKSNWLSRVFAIEYATWFRLMLPGLARLGLPVPLGGTTVYFRRAALEAMGGWDAHNVTEDADLGIRLARHGYRTEMAATVTREEANNRLWPWIRQRARWQKGYALTWAVHSRAPARMLRDFGMWRSFGMQALLFGTLIQALLAPLLWSFWLIVAGLPHPAEALLGPAGLRALVWLFIGAEGITLVAAAVAVTRSPHRGLLPWVPSMLLYLPLGTLALYRAIWCLMRDPFFWDKTQHGRSAPDDAEADRMTS